MTSSPKKGRTGFRHPNYWFAWAGFAICAAVTAANDPLHLFSTYEDAPDDLYVDGLSFWFWITLFLGIFLLLGMAPRVQRVGDGLRITNAFKTTIVPLGEIADVDSTFGYAAIELSSGKKIAVLAMEQFAVRDDLKRLGILIESPSTPSGESLAINRGGEPPRKWRRITWEDVIVVALALGYPFAAAMANWPNLGI